MIKYFFHVLLLSSVLEPGIVDSCLRRAGEYAGHQASKELRQASENSAKELAKGLKEITSSLDNGVAVGQEVFRELSHNLTKLLDNIDVRIDSGELAHIGADAAKSLQIALSDLTENWKVVVKSEDLKSIGAEAFGHLSQALQNLNAKIHVHLSIDNNLTRAVLYISVAIGIAFSVCFVAIIISVKSCRKCFMNMLQSLKSTTCHCCVTVENGQTGREATMIKLENMETNNLDCGEPMLSDGGQIHEWRRDNDINGDGTKRTDNKTKSLAEMRGQGYEGMAPLLSIFDKNQHNCNSNYKVQTHF